MLSLVSGGFPKSTLAASDQSWTSTYGSSKEKAEFDVELLRQNGASFVY